MALDWSNIYKKYKGLWVALKDDEVTVISSGKTAKDALEKARKKGINSPILTRMPNKLISFISSN